jgi:hypothetical protein
MRPKWLGLLGTGGEGGIRTLGTGVSPYNGLANSARPLPIAWNQSFTLIVGALVRMKKGTSGGFMHLNMHLLSKRFLQRKSGQNAAGQPSVPADNGRGSSEAQG